MDHFRGPLLGIFQQVHNSPVLRTPHLGATLQVRSRRAEGQGPLPHPASHTALDAAQVPVGFLGCVGSLLARVHIAIHQHPLSPFWWVLSCGLAFVQEVQR